MGTLQIVDGQHAKRTGDFEYHLGGAGIDSQANTQKPNATNGLVSKDRLVADLEADTVTWPPGVAVSICRSKDGTELHTL